MSAVTLAIKPELRGRVMAIMMMTHGVMPLGMIPIAAAAEFIGIGVALLASAGMLAVSMWAIGLWFPALKRLDKGHGEGEGSAFGDGPVASAKRVAGG